MADLTQTQKDDFRRAVDFWNGDEESDLSCPLIEEQDIIQTHETMESFEKSPFVTELKKMETPHGLLRYCEGVQVRKGCRRGELFVMDFGGVLAIAFTGENPNSVL